MRKAVFPGLDVDRYVDLIFSLDDAEQAEAENMAAEHERPYRALYDDLEAGRIDVFSFRQDTNVRVVARSTRPGVLIQASCFWDRDGELIALSHKDVNSFSDLREVIPQAETEVSWTA